MVHVKVAVVQVLVPSWTAVAVYEVMGEPPSDTGAVHESTAERMPEVALTERGSLGGLGSGVTALDGLDATEVPAMLVEVTVKV